MARVIIHEPQAPDEPIHMVVKLVKPAFHTGEPIPHLFDNS